jgi:alpha-D-ribose 1-methylphosphonate 5-triphosphate diphosphatase
MTLSLTLKNAEVLRPDGVSFDALSLHDGEIVDGPIGREIDLCGFRIRPGIIDVHGDGFERHLAPRRGAMTDLSAGLASAEADLAANGITTAMLAQFWSWEGGMRGPDFARRMLEALADYQTLGTDMRVQLRFETHMLDDYPQILEIVRQYQIGFVVFNDHLPHDALNKGKRPPRLTGQALKGGRSPESHHALLKALHANGALVPDALAELANELAERGVIMGSHDDGSAAARRSARAMGLSVSEFPETREAAEEAAQAGDPVVLGAPNVVRGGSHSGNVSAAALIADGIGDALASDYHYPAPLQAALTLENWALVSEGPARLLGLEDRGQLLPGKRADLVVLDQRGRVGATIAAGRITHLAGEVAERFVV